MLCRVKRLWAAMALVEVFDGRKSIADIATNYAVRLVILKVLYNRQESSLVKFRGSVAEIGWTSMEAMIKICREINFNPNMNADLDNLLAISSKLMTHQGWLKYCLKVEFMM